MYKRIVKFLDKQNILSESQYGFRKKRSTNLAILELVTKISKAIDDNEFTMGVFLDLSPKHSILWIVVSYFRN